MKRRLLMTICALAVTTIGILGRVEPEPVFASCAILPSLSRFLPIAPVVFAGKVIAIRSHAMSATARVEDVWRGKHVPKIATVNNDSQEDFRIFRKGVTYLFDPEPVSPFSPYQDNACTATRRYSRALAKYRPANAHRP